MRKKVQFNPVKITNADSCLSYVLKRVQPLLAKKIRTAEEIEEHFEVKPYIDGNDINGQGMIVMWEEQMSLAQNTEITESGKLIATDRHKCRHFGVIEEDGLISDASRWGVSYTLLHIRVRRFDTVKRPTHILIPRA